MSTCRKGDIVAAEIAHVGKTKPTLALARVVSADRNGIAKKIARVSDAVPLEVRAGVRVFTLQSFQPEARALFKKSTPHSWQTRDALREAILAEKATTMLDTTPITTAIARMIAAGTPEGEILARVVRTFPDLTLAELSAALQEATDKAERQATRRH